MTINEIKQLIVNDESRTLELKKSTSELVKGMQTLCAFLNTGVCRMVEAYKAVGLPEPEYGTDGTFVWITFKRPSSVTSSVTNLVTNLDTNTIQKTIQKRTKLQTDIIEYLRKAPYATQKEMAENIDGATLGGIKYNLIRLQKNGDIKRIGGDKGGFWEIIEQ